MKCILLLILSLLFLFIIFKPLNIEAFKTKQISQTDQLLRDGYLIIPNIVSHEECNNILSIIKTVELESHKCGNVHSNINRKDMMIPVKKIKKHIKNIYHRTEDIWEDIVPNAILCECSSLISYPGAHPQIWRWRSAQSLRRIGALRSPALRIDPAQHRSQSQRAGQARRHQAM